MNFEELRDALIEVLHKNDLPTVLQARVTVQIDQKPYGPLVIEVTEVNIVHTRDCKLHIFLKGEAP